MIQTQEAPANVNVYEKSTTMRGTLEALRAFHEAPDVFGKLAPPPIFARVQEDNRTSLTEGDLRFTLWFGPIPIRWHAQHQPGPTADSFADLMLEGPLRYWRHEHIFEAVEGGVKLTDRVTLAHKPGLPGVLTRLMFDGLPLRFLFFYRHLRTKRSVESKA